MLGWPALPTHRQYRTWTVWELGEWNRPSRSDHYVMQLTAEVRRIVGWMNKNPGPLSLDKLKISFKSRSSEEEPIDVEEISRRAMAVWRARLRINEDGTPRKKPVVRRPPQRTDRNQKTAESVPSK